MRDSCAIIILNNFKITFAQAFSIAHIGEKFAQHKIPANTDYYEITEDIRYRIILRYLLAIAGTSAFVVDHSTKIVTNMTPTKYFIFDRNLVYFGYCYSTYMTNCQ